MNYNVKDFGAAGNGSTDDKLAIQQAIDAAHEAGGGTVYIPEGTYIVSGNHKASYGAILLRDNVTLEGAGMGKTIIKLADGWDHKVTGIIRTKSAEINENITVRDLTIDGNMQNTKGEVDGFFTGVTPGVAKADQNILVERVEIHSVSRYGFDPHEQTVGLTIRDSVAHHNGYDGFTIDFQSFGSLINNISYANGRHGFNVVTGSHDMTLLNNVAYDNGAEGLVIQRGSDDRDLTNNIYVEGGSFYNNGRNGVLVKISTDVTVKHVDVYGNGRYGIELDGASRTLISDNEVYNNSQSGNGKYHEIKISGYDDKNGASGKYFAATDNIITGNLIYADGDIRSAYGIKEENSSSTGNTISNNLLAGFLKGDVSTVNAVVELADHQLDLAALVNMDTTKYGTSGYDVLQGTDANDLITGADAEDTLNGGNGDDLMMGGDDADELKGERGNDTLIGGEGDDDLNGNQGDDVIHGDGGSDTIHGSTGNDTLDGGDDKDYLLGGSHNDVLYGGAGNDTLSGNKGDDLIIGGDGKDTLRGGDGNDTLYGGAGEDKLYGHGGVDIFVFANDAGKDLVRDFEDGTDRIDLTAFTGLSFADLDIDRKGGSTLINVDEDTSIYLKNVHISDVSEADFIFA